MTRPTTDAPQTESRRALFERGLRKRRKVLGDEYVDRSLATATDFGRPLQELVTEYCWGAIWGRDAEPHGLPDKTRSLLNIAMLTALNRPHELELHVAGALRNGVSADEIREVLLQAAIYCGVPAAIDAMRVAQRVLSASGRIDAPPPSA